AARRSRPSNRMRPPSTRALGASRRMTEKAVTDLPQPDSPTRARVSPGSTAKLTSRTATWPGKATVSWSTASKLMGLVRRLDRSRAQRGVAERPCPRPARPLDFASLKRGSDPRDSGRRLCSWFRPRIEDLVQAVADQVERQHRGGDGDAGQRG